ncbi:unnamed protein product, partial [Mesorhabditis belari]|uniref:T-box domain-containing protein n=1 Tax=Mesorhabditis belari TaxID=2138241 RepID=A0AAF3J1Q6_9BILA
MQNGITVSIENHKLWEKFQPLGNEMIITKVGRKMFPRLEYNIRGLDPIGLYQVFLYLRRADDFRWKYNGAAKWQKAGPGEPPEHSDPRAIPWNDNNGASIGRELMERPLMFDTFKMTNNIIERDRKPGLVYVQSMHRYLPELRIYRLGPNGATTLVHEFCTSLTEFFAVTCYQNPEVTKEKIAFNPFAKGFRESNGRKRSHTPPSEDGSSNSIRGTPTEPGLHAEEKKFSPTIGNGPPIEWVNHPYPMPHHPLPPAATTQPMPWPTTSWHPMPQHPPLYQFNTTFNLPPVWPSYPGMMESGGYWNMAPPSGIPAGIPPAFSRPPLILPHHSDSDNDEPAPPANFTLLA